MYTLSVPEKLTVVTAVTGGKLHLERGAVNMRFKLGHYQPKATQSG
jgi:hypothetical protein